MDLLDLHVCRSRQTVQDFIGLLKGGSDAGGLALALEFVQGDSHVLHRNLYLVHFLENSNRLVIVQGFSHHFIPSSVLKA